MINRRHDPRGALLVVRTGARAWRVTLVVLAAVTAGLLLPGIEGEGRAQAVVADPTESTLPKTPGPVPLAEEFSRTETAVAMGATAAGLYLLAAGSTLFDPPKPSMGPPDRDSIDARLAGWLYRPEGGRLWGGAPDLIGIAVVPALPLLMYGIDTAALLRTGRPWLRPSQMNPHHHLLAYVEAVGWTMLLSGVIKYVVGRPRPYTEGSLDHPELRQRGSEDNLSFFSAHAAIDFAVGAFVTQDVSRALLRGPLAGSTPVSRFLLGHLLPAMVGYGVPTLVGISRIVDQQHWPSDVVAGGLSGALIAHLVYATHFDAEGLPRRRNALTLAPIMASGPTGVGPSAGLAMSGRF
jgi:membrane-associated phospholipid phosphatase